ncbi:MAG: hypothetical protein KF745_01275 [Phycisphaeraceae bacterium]|nr:hypothetical protein [Phycisphaeraceae bacterium]
MGIDFALDELYATGWSSLDTADCNYNTDGRTFPSLDRVKAEFAGAGLSLTLRRIDKFNCWRAEWSDSSGRVSGGVVGHSEADAAVYALAQMRRQTLSATV